MIAKIVLLTCTGLVLSTTSLAQTATPVPPKVALCQSCHGEGGNSTDDAYPVLAAQNSRYLYLELRDFQEGRRSNELMSPIASALTRDEMHELADYFSQQKHAPSSCKSDAEKERLGKAKADEVLCTMCHLGGFVGQNEIPKVAGQRYGYVVKQLHAFKEHKRTNDAGNMTSVAGPLSDADIDNLAHYICNL